MLVSAERFANFFQDAFGTVLARDFPTSKIHSSYPVDSINLRRCIDYLLRIEHKFVQELIRHLYDMTRRAGRWKREKWGFDSFKVLSRPYPDHDSACKKEDMYAMSRDQVE